MQEASWEDAQLLVLRSSINNTYRCNESIFIETLIDKALLEPNQVMMIRENALQLIENIRKIPKNSFELDAFLQDYPLRSEEGVALMCLAEALLRIPDKKTATDLIKDKLMQGDWAAYLQEKSSFLRRILSWGLHVSDCLLNPTDKGAHWRQCLRSLGAQTSTPVIRETAKAAMRLLSKQFIVGENIEEALRHTQKKLKKGQRRYLYSYDILGEAALTEEESARYYKEYFSAIQTIGKQPLIRDPARSIQQQPGISLKLSALHPRYEETQRGRIMKDLMPKLLTLAQSAKADNLALMIDAEESERLELSLDLIEATLSHPSLQGWNGFGMVIQAYQKRALSVVDWAAALARKHNHRLMVRLVKGAYWDSEIKKSQMQGLEYPVFTHKVFTDLSFQACAKKLLRLSEDIYPQFATHNAYTAATILQLADEETPFELQCLQGMGQPLYEQILNDKARNVTCRIYAPVGSYARLLPYLARRLLENGANSSFVNQILDPNQSMTALVDDPVEKARTVLNHPKAVIPLVADIFLPERKNAMGLDLTDRVVVESLLKSHAIFKSSIEPVSDVSEETLDCVLNRAEKGMLVWERTTVSFRATCLRRLATILEENRDQLLSALCVEGGKTWVDGIAEVREAIDFCYYYAALAEKLLLTPKRLKGYTGESNELSLHPRGIVACISPWNFPLAIFTGQVVAALVTGNCVIAKPAEQTPWIATLAVSFMHAAGIPTNVVQLVPGTGEVLGAALVEDRRIQAVIFTGSTETAATINTLLATRGGPLVPLIAETGGQNAMIVDSSALLEQVVMDVITSAFGSAGQRCSALRVLYVQADIYDVFLDQLKGAMAELKTGDPSDLSTDVGPVIDKKALHALEEHVRLMQQQGYPVLYQCPHTPVTTNKEKKGFMPPTVIAIPAITVLKEEVFGPILHLVAYKKNQLETVIHQINQTGYGLTLGIHSRIQNTIEFIRSRVRVGNCYVNRNMVGAVVGLQPFGGEGLSGTGPKAGGPHYLLRLCTERTFTVNTTAMGGNTQLMAAPLD